MESYDTPRITALSATTIALFDMGVLSTYRWNGSAWIRLGSNILINNITARVGLDALNSTTIVYLDVTNKDVMLYQATQSFQ